MNLGRVKFGNKFIAQQNHCLKMPAMSKPAKLKIGSPATGDHYFPTHGPS